MRSIGFLYLECPECEFSTVVELAQGTCACPLCFLDNHRNVMMAARPARHDDRPEGVDQRKELQ